MVARGDQQIWIVQMHARSLHEPCTERHREETIERVWLHLRQRFLSFRLYWGKEAIVDALSAAWNALHDETGRPATLTSYPWIAHATGQISRSGK